MEYWRKKLNCEIEGGLMLGLGGSEVSLRLNERLPNVTLTNGGKRR